MNSKTIVVIGAGPVGGILTAHLCAFGCAVHLVDAWKEHIERISTDGLRIKGQGDIVARPAALYDSVKALSEIVPDYVFLCTKACDLEGVLSEMSERLKRSKAVFVSFQNGIDTEQAIAKFIEKSRVLRGVVSYAGVLVGPGEIRKSFFAPPNYVGWLEEGSANSCKETAALLSASGLTTEATGEIGRYAWRKTILNTCTMAIAAVTGLNIEEMVQFHPTAQLIELLLQESVAVAAAYGFDYGPEFADKVRDFNRNAGPHRPSMRVDLENGRKTENEFIVRRIAEYGEKKGIPVQLHRTMANLIDALESRGRHSVS